MTREWKSSGEGRRSDVGPPSRINDPLFCGKGVCSFLSTSTWRLLPCYRVALRSPPPLLVVKRPTSCWYFLSLFEKRATDKSWTRIFRRVHPPLFLFQSSRWKSRGDRNSDESPLLSRRVEKRDRKETFSETNDDLTSEEETVEDDSEERSKATKERLWRRLFRKESRWTRLNLEDRYGGTWIETLFAKRFSIYLNKILAFSFFHERNKPAWTRKRRERGKEIRVPFEFSFLLISERETKLARLYRSWFERVKNNSATRAINGWKEFSR